MAKKKEEFTKGGEVYKKLFKENDEKNSDNSVKVASRPIEVYTQTILNKLQKFDQIEICAQDNYLDRALYIIRLWEALGVVPINGPQIRFEKREEDIITRDGKIIRRPVNRITLTKQPEQFRFTKN